MQQTCQYGEYGEYFNELEVIVLENSVSTRDNSFSWYFRCLAYSVHITCNTPEYTLFTGYASPTIRQRRPESLL